MRTIGLRHFDEQLLGGIVLHRNMIAEMKTGEGKTLVATLPLYLAALTGRGAHLVTPNDYLSKVGAQWMGPVYHLLGLIGGRDPVAWARTRRMGSFLYDPDYPRVDDRYHQPASLRPRRGLCRPTSPMAPTTSSALTICATTWCSDLSQCVQRELYYAIVDEVDNILIDEARTPLIISAPGRRVDRPVPRFAEIVARLHEGARLYGR